MFSLPEEVKSIGINEEGKTKLRLLEAFLGAAEKAWQQAILPRMETIRQGGVLKNSAKGGGTDFFTEADVESEKIIKHELIEQFGADGLRIFGEEENSYVGNLNAAVTIRIDPIDGTEAFKFGKPNWSVMIGAYTGRNENERQIVSVIYYPEYYNEVLFYIDGIGAFIGSNTSGKIKKLSYVDTQDELGNIIVIAYKHSNLKNRGNIDEIIKKLENGGARVKSCVPTEIKEALETKGKRAFVIDGDFNLVDFIMFSVLVRQGYKIFDWQGTEYNVDDPVLSDMKIVLIPPGKAGEKILEIVKLAQK